MAAAMLVPAGVDLYENNPDAGVFIAAALMTSTISILLWLGTRGAKWQFSIRGGFLLICALWAVAVLVGSLPLYFSHLVLNFAEAVFETASGLTTTGATVLTELDRQASGILLWRSLLCWLGGIGFVVLALLLLPSLRIGGTQLFYMESSEKSEKIFPRIRQISHAIIIAYLALTVLCVICYYGAGMSFFDAFNHALTTISTAGFSTHDASLGFYHNNRILLVSTIFMFLAALPFVLYIKLVSFSRLYFVKDPQVILFTKLVLFGTFAVAIWLHFTAHIPFHEAFVRASFHFVSVITTTGYAVEDYTLWGPFCFALFFCATFLGGCAGSTSGGLKMNRVLILYRFIKVSLLKIPLPNTVQKVYYGDSEVSNELLRAILLFFLLYFVSLILGTTLLIMAGADFITAFSGSLTALSNVGPGFGDQIGPVGNFSLINGGGLWVLTFLMLAGRLELVTIYMLFVPALWRRD